MNKGFLEQSIAIIVSVFLLGGIVFSSYIDKKISESLNLSGATLVRVPQGGTGWASLEANSVLLGNGTSRLATTSAGTNGYILSLVSGVPDWVATSSITGLPFPFTPTADGNSTSTRLIFGNGFISQASSTISNALRIDGGLTLGDIADGNLVYSVSGLLTATSTANLKSTLKLNLVENTALSTWVGSANLTTLGTITTGTWNAGSVTSSGAVTAASFVIGA